MRIGDIIQFMFDGAADQTPPTTCEACSNSVADPSSWKRETYTGHGVTVVDICPRCDSTVNRYYGPN